MTRKRADPNTCTLSLIGFATTDKFFVDSQLLKFNVGLTTQLDFTNDFFSSPLAILLGIFPSPPPFMEFLLAKLCVCALPRSTLKFGDWSAQ